MDENFAVHVFFSQRLLRPFLFSREDFFSYFIMHLVETLVNFWSVFYFLPTSHGRFFFAKSSTPPSPTDD